MDGSFQHNVPLHLDTVSASLPTGCFYGIMVYSVTISLVCATANKRLFTVFLFPGLAHSTEHTGTQSITMDDEVLEVLNFAQR